MPDQTNEQRFFFDDPRLKMTFIGRILVRVVTWVAYLFLVVGALTFLLSDLPWLRVVGLFFILFLLDTFIHRKEADRMIEPRPAHGGRLLRRIPHASSVNLARYISPEAFSCIEKAFDHSSLGRRDFFLELAHVLAKSGTVHKGLSRLDVPTNEFEQKIEDLLRLEVARATISKDECLVEVEALVKEAFRVAGVNGHKFIGIPDIFASLPLVGSETMGRLFSMFSIDPGDLERALLLGNLRGSFFSRVPREIGGFLFETYKPLRHRVMNRAWTARPTPALDSLSTDLTDLARRGEIGFLVGHEEEYHRLVNVLARPSNPNALLVGDAGAGKTTIVHHLALSLVKDKISEMLFDKRLVELHISGLVSGAAPHELQARLTRVVDEITTAGNVILYIPDIHNLVKTSGTAFLSAADALMPILMSNAFPVIGGSFPREFKEFIEPRSDFVGIFDVIRVQELAEEEAEKVLLYASVLLERQTNVIVSFQAIKQSVRLAKKYFHNKLLPASALEILKEAAVDARARGDEAVRGEAIIRIVETKVNIPVHEAGKEEAASLLHLEDAIHEHFIDQEEAVKAVCEALREYRSGLARTKGPIASFLFVGPTGVGKTELSKILAKVQFGSEKLMVRFDMSEYQDKQSFFRLIGSPDGTIHGSLTEAVLERPYCLVLLDEFEKSHPDILNLFLQVLDDGRLTDNLSRTVDFQNTIVIATSNAHSDIVNEALDRGESIDQIAEYLKKRLADVFKPELLNRFTKIIIFKNLPPDAVYRVAELNLKSLSEALSLQGIQLVFNDSAVQEIAKRGYDPAFGARPLRRVIDETIKAPLSEKILRKEVVKGGTLRVAFEDGAFTFESSS